MNATILYIVLLSTVEWGPVGFSGNAQFTFQYDTLSGISQTRPAMIATWQFNPTFTIYGIPISMDMSLSSVKNGFLNQLEALTITFEPSQLLSRIPSLPGFLFAFPMISWGTTNPEFSPFTISGVSVQGFTVKYAPGKLFFAVTRGALANSDSTMGEIYKRKTFGYRVGVGAPNGAHLHLLYVHFLDDTGAQSIVDSLPPRENFVLGFSTGIKLRDYMNLSAEIVGSEVTDDIRDSVISNERIPSWATNQFKPRISTHFDVAGRAKLSMKFGRTQARIYGLYVGPGFESFGVTLMKKDAIEYGTELRTTLFRGLVSFNGSFKRQQDNLLGTKGITTSYTFTHVDVSLAPPNLPFLQFYTDYSLQSVDDTMNLSTGIYGFSAGYPYQVRSLNLYSQLSLTYQKSDVPDTIYKAQSYFMLVFSQSVALTQPFTFNFSGSYGRFDASGTSSSRKSADFSVSYTHRKVMPTLGFSHSSSNTDRRNDLYMRLSYRPGWGISVSSTAMYSTGKSTSSSDFTEKRFTLSVGKSW